MTTVTENTLTELRDQKESLQLQAEIATLQGHVNVAEAVSRMVDVPESIPPIVDRFEYLHDTPGFGTGHHHGRQRISLPGDRKNGAFFPHFLTEQDLGRIRGEGQFLATTDETSMGILENLTNYTIGTGFIYEATPKPEAGPVLAAIVQKVIDEFDELNHWGGDLEREVFSNSRRDGEKFLKLSHVGSGNVRARVVDAPNITEPANPRVLEDFIGAHSLNWKFGIATDQGDVERVHGYYVEWEPDGHSWDFVPERVQSLEQGAMHHIKLNVDRTVKRGLSDWYGVTAELERAAKLLRNTAEGASIQAAIAFIREHVGGTSQDQISSFQGNKTDFSFDRRTGDGGTRTVKMQRFDPGHIVDTRGTKYHAGPLGTPRGQSYLDIGAAVLRVVGTRWTMPEHVVSGDASNNNLASILEAGSPFQLSIMAKQHRYECEYRQILWKVVHLAFLASRFRGKASSFADIKRQVEIGIEAPSTETTKKLEEEQIRAIRSQAGILSRQTWAAQADLDFDVEVEQGASPAPPPPPPAQESAGGGLFESAEARRRAAIDLVWENYP